MVCVRISGQERFEGFDFLLPTQFWVDEAVKHAQTNMVSYGFDKLPTITPESLIFAKLISLNNNPERYQDMDDISHILKEQIIHQELIDDYITASQINFREGVLDLLKK